MKKVLTKKVLKVLKKRLRVVLKAHLRRQVIENIALDKVVKLGLDGLELGLFSLRLNSLNSPDVSVFYLVCLH